MRCKVNFKDSKLQPTSKDLSLSWESVDAVMANTTQAQRPSNQELVNTIRGLGDEIRTIASKASQLERDSEEHSVVVETLKKTDPARKCFRMIGGVMIERTVKEILPDLEEHRSNINDALKTLLSQYQSKNTEMQDYQKKWNVKVTVTP
ncbi:hypothetical protein PSHT_13040 [Puccinia striiformis]|uniref:Prefoldin subunit 2 n=5 Tax=Puccinia striiformis TaxID=27350 RepID=A0A0L0VDF8_9BASI|nr:hypothetical protein PSTG_09715 [Puccinia striiformis f. sp. tritici PST-78]POW00407.1 hypothetical protein PSHT_13040 [Puccinia striiformis]